MKYLVILGLVLGQISASAQIDNDTLRIGVFESPPFVIINDAEEYSGVSYWVWEQLEKNIDRPFVFVRYPKENALEILMNDLENDKIDFSINPLTLTNKRHERFDFTYPFYIGNLTMVEKSVTKLHSIERMLAEIFNYRFLYLILILASLVLFFGFIMWLVEKRNDHFERGRQGLLASFWWSAVTMTTVGYGDKVPISNSGRFVAFIWMLCSIIIISIFTASITSNLTVYKLSNSDSSLDQYKQNVVGTVKSSATESFMRRNFFRNIKTYPDLENGLESLQLGNVDLFMYDEPWLHYQLFNNSKFDDLDALSMRFAVQLYAIPMRMGLDEEIKSLITNNLLDLTESAEWNLLLEEYQLKEFDTQ